LYIFVCTHILASLFRSGTSWKRALTHILGVSKE
jgi:hypothetical protein